MFHKMLSLVLLPSLSLAVLVACGNGTNPNFNPPPAPDLSHVTPRDMTVSHAPDLTASSSPENDDTSCSDGIDNDGNGLTDCADPSCCSGGVPGAGVTVCAQGTCQGPGNMMMSMNDMSVSGADGGVKGPKETTDALCSDGIDNDGNGFSDCNDFSCCRKGVPGPGITVCAAGTCIGPGKTSADGGTVKDAGTTGDMAGKGPKETTDVLCSDGIDNDGNGFTDCSDFSCCKAGVPAPGVTVCAAGTCIGPGKTSADGGTVKDAGTTGDMAGTKGPKETTDALCSDGIDNDGNGYTDCNDYSCCSKAGVPAPGVTVCAAGTCKGPGKP